MAVAHTPTGVEDAVFMVRLSLNRIVRGPLGNLRALAVLVRRNQCQLQGAAIGMMLQCNPQSIPMLPSATMRMTLKIFVRGHHSGRLAKEDLLNVTDVEPPSTQLVTLLMIEIGLPCSGRTHCNIPFALTVQNR